jgi:glucose-6-phosphate dehydrogenase assembly protein OpcA
MSRLNPDDLIEGVLPGAHRFEEEFDRPCRIQLPGRMTDSGLPGHAEFSVPPRPRGWHVGSDDFRFGIKPDDILRELSAQWKNLGASQGRETDKVEEKSDGLLRACSMTLICFADDEEDWQTLDETLASVIREHPSRTLIIRLRDGENEPAARVSSRCWKPFGLHRQICCEQVEITASIDRLADVASIAAPLAVPDLPRVVILRSARIVRAGALRKVLPLGDKIIVDSSRSGAPGFGEIGGLLDAGHITGDLAWTQLTPIRALLARLLGNRSPTAVMIEYTGKEPGPGVLYLQAWLETALPGTVISGHRNGLHGDGKPAVVRVDEDLAVRLCPGGAEIDTGAVRRRASMPSTADDRLLREELGILVHDPIFERTLSHITA